MTEKAVTRRFEVAAMGDLHIREDNAESYRELFGEISREADVLVLAGDLTDLGKRGEARVAGAGSEGLLDPRRRRSRQS